MTITADAGTDFGAKKSAPNDPSTRDPHAHFQSCGRAPTRKLKMFVNKRDGRQEEVKFDKITARISKLCYGLNPEYVDPVGASCAAEYNPKIRLTTSSM